LAVGLHLCMNLRTKKICRTGIGPEGKPDRLQAIIFMPQQAGLVLKTCVKVDTPFNIKGPLTSSEFPLA